jgi:prepilin-type processing-associated H-X9-DG protein
MKNVVYALSVIFASALSSSRAEEGRSRAITPFLDNDVIGVGHVDLTKVDVEKLARSLITDQEQGGEMVHTLSPWILSLRKAGARELYAIVVLPELLSPSRAPISIVVPLDEGADAKAIGEILCGGGAAKGTLSWPTCATVHNAVFAGTSEALERVRQLRPVERPELSAALNALGSTDAEFVLTPSSDTRRVLEELLPSLPGELGGGPITEVTRGMLWTAIGFKAEPEPRLQFLVQGKDAAAAQTLHQLGKKGLAYLRQAPGVSRYAPEFAKLADDLSAETHEDRITITIGANKASTWAAAIIMPLREKATRSQCVNNLKQIGLAMHIYHDRHHTFPPAYLVDKAGKPLLSWRVLILPFIEQEALYKEFHLDEPWDSQHNKTLIDRMPPTYRCPASRGKRADIGKTTYLVPRGASTIFPGPEGVKIQKITDGTSNTIFVVDAGDDRAVPWTKPEDWEIGPSIDLKGIFGHHPGGTNFAFADGSVRFLKEIISPDLLRKLITCNGGELISSDDY